MIDAFEGRDIAVADVFDAYLHAEFLSEKRVILKLRGVFADIMCQVNSEYIGHIVHEVDRKGRQVKTLYIRVLRALYGCLKLALLWYKLYSSTLVKLGFEIHLYDKCFANKMINGKQYTIVFYIDDNKISHADENAVTNIIETLSSYFGELTESRGNNHDNLGMYIELKNRKVHVGMKDQMLEAIEWGGNQKGWMPPTPANADLFSVDEQAVSLN